jgi:hypothetical protein
MNFLKVVEIDKDGNTKEAVSSVCYHPVQEKRLRNGEKVEPQFCAVDIFDTDNVEEMKKIRDGLLLAADEINKKIYGR